MSVKALVSPGKLVLVGMFKGKLNCLRFKKVAHLKLFHWKIKCIKVIALPFHSLEI